MKKHIFIPCSCTSEAVHFVEDEDNNLYISIWEIGHGRDNTYTWRQRFKHCWQVLTQGRPYGDQVVLDRKGRSELIYSLVNNYILNKIDTSKNN